MIAGGSVSFISSGEGEYIVLRVESGSSHCGTHSSNEDVGVLEIALASIISSKVRGGGVFVARELFMSRRKPEASAEKTDIKGKTK